MAFISLPNPVLPLSGPARPVLSPLRPTSARPARPAALPVSATAAPENWKDVKAAASDAKDAATDAVKDAAKGMGLGPDTTALGSLTVSSLGIGTWAWGDRLFWGYKPEQDKALQAAFNACVDGKVNFFDTAEVYGPGQSERLCGRFAREYKPSEGATPLEGDIHIATKFAPLPFRFSRKSVVDALKSSLNKLGAEKVDMYQIHWPAFLQEQAFWDGLADCVDLGLVTEVGVSNYSAARVKACHKLLSARGIPLVSNQVQYSLLHRNPELNGTKEACEELGVKILAYSPLAQGVLTGKYSATNMPTGPRKFALRKAIDDSLPLLIVLKDIAEKRGKTVSQIALNWCMCKDAIPIPGVRTVKQAEDNIGALGWRLSADEVAALDELSLSLNKGNSTMAMPMGDSDFLIPKI